MKILILSDNHMRDIKLKFNKYDYVIHCGDYGNCYDMLNNFTLVVRGNCDYEGPKEIITNINNKEVLITHGDMFNVKYHYNSLIYRAIEKKINVVFFGHTHRQDMFVEDNIIFINPGSYQNGDYVEIDDEHIYFYRDDSLFKRYDYRW